MFSNDSDLLKKYTNYWFNGGHFGFYLKKTKHIICGCPMFSNDSDLLKKYTNYWFNGGHFGFYLKKTKLSPRIRVGFSGCFYMALLSQIPLKKLC